MIRLVIFFILCSLCISCSTTYYIVRHGEKAVQEPNMSSDVPLSEAGLRRAERLKIELHSKKIRNVFSTNTIRTRSTVKPTADFFQVDIQTYGPRPDTAFITKLKSIKGNTVIAGHSNTVDDIVNMLTGRSEVKGDLLDTEYSNLFIVTKKGSRYTFERKQYGMP